jgi:hypothetical protein
METGKVKEIDDEFNLHDDIILQILRSFPEHVEAPKKEWLQYTPPPNPIEEVQAIVNVPMEPPKERPMYVEPLPLPRTIEKHMIVQQLAEQLEEEQKFLRGQEEAAKVEEIIRGSNKKKEK